MSSYKKMAKVLILAALSLGLGACSKKKNGSSSAAAAATPASACTLNAYGQYVDQYGRICNNVGNAACTNAVWDVAGNRWIDRTNGQVINANCSGQVGYGQGYGYYPHQTNYGNGCSTWSQIYPGTYYVPVDLGNGQMVCVNAQLMQQYNPGYNWYNYAYSNQPVYACYDYYSCGGGYYGGHQYSCGNSVNLSFLGSSFGAGLNLCL